MKTCSKCGETKPFDSFGKHALGRDGLQPACKKCLNAQAAEWYAQNKERKSVTQAKWQAENKEKREAKKAEWRANNKDKWVMYNHNRRARRITAGGKLTAGLSDLLFKLQRGKCACGCGKPLGDDYHLDHIMPLALGGTNTDDNIQLLRKTCNLKKGTKHPIDFMQTRGFLL